MTRCIAVAAILSPSANATSDLVSAPLFISPREKGKEYKQRRTVQTIPTVPTVGSLRFYPQKKMHVKSL